MAKDAETGERGRIPRLRAAGRALGRALDRVRAAIRALVEARGLRDRPASGLARGSVPGPRPLRPPRLLRDSLGREACVACFLCETVCPARCIRVVSGPDPAPDGERRPKEFEIDLLRCAFCGLCEEVCPADAIELSGPPLAPADALDRARLGLEDLLRSDPAGAP